MLSISEAGLISTCLQGLLQGILYLPLYEVSLTTLNSPTGCALMMFMLTVFILTRGHRNKRLNVGMLLASSTLTLLSSAVR